MCLLARPKARSASISLWTARKASAGTKMVVVLVKNGSNDPALCAEGVSSWGPPIPTALSFQTEVNCNFSVFGKPILALKLTSSSVMPST